MRIRITKTADLDDDIVRQVLSEFADWLDEKGLLREGAGDFKYKYNRDLAEKFVSDRQGDPE